MMIELLDLGMRESVFDYNTEYPIRKFTKNEN